MTSSESNQMDPAAVSDCYIRSLDPSINFVSNVPADA